MSLDLVANLNHKPNCQCSFCKAMRGETSGINNNNYRHGIYTKRHYCVNCSKEISISTILRGKNLCSSCARLGNKNSNWKNGLPKCIKCGEALSAYNIKTSCCSNCIDRSMENNPNWQNGISFEFYSEEFNYVLKEQIRERDNRICQICEKTEIENKRKLEVHHINYDKKDNNLNNLIALCKHCHMKTNYNRDYWEKEFKREVLLCL